MTAKDRLITGNIGLYLACSHLSRWLWNTMPTSRNMKGVDIIVHKEGSPRLIGIQVKAVKKINPIILGEKKRFDTIGKDGDDYWVIVCNVGRAPEAFKPECYVLLPREVRKLAEKKGESFFLQPKDYRKDKFREKWERIK